jgi:hypothetical protein
MKIQWFENRMNSTCFVNSTCFDRLESNDLTSRLLSKQVDDYFIDPKIKKPQLSSVLAKSLWFSSSTFILLDLPGKCKSIISLLSLSLSSLSFLSLYQKKKKENSDKVKRKTLVNYLKSFIYAVQKSWMQQQNYKTKSNQQQDLF